jgi:aryl-alcohol dehydrogenase-like predicted oxidoreductase
MQGLLSGTDERAGTVSPCGGAGTFGTARVVCNVLNFSRTLPSGYPAHTRRARVGVVGIRVLAGGALSGSPQRHPVASPAPQPIGSALSYETDLTRASRLLPLVAEGFAASLPEAAIRFAIAHPAMGTILVGVARVEQFEAALAAVLKGPLPAAALHRVTELTGTFSGETR